MLSDGLEVTKESGIGRKELDASSNLILTGAAAYGEDEQDKQSREPLERERARPRSSYTATQHSSEARSLHGS